MAAAASCASIELPELALHSLSSVYPHSLSPIQSSPNVGEIGMPLDLGLDLKLFVARTAGRLAAAKEPPAVDACIRGLDEERRKIEVFRRELPFCVRLLAEVIEVMKEEAAKRSAVRDAAAAKADDSDKRKWIR